MAASLGCAPQPTQPHEKSTDATLAGAHDRIPCAGFLHPGDYQSLQLPHLCGNFPPFHCWTTMCYAFWPFIWDLWSKHAGAAPHCYLTTPVSAKQSCYIVPALHYCVYLVWEKTNTIIRTCSLQSIISKNNFVLNLPFLSNSLHFINMFCYVLIIESTVL